ncbi:hypothetical protein [Flagellimonas sp. 2504JD4-2]
MGIKHLLILLCCISTKDIVAQSWSIGGGAVYGDAIENIGIHFRGYYNLPNNKVCFGPEYSNFFEKTASNNGVVTTKALSEINLNLHYIMEISEGWGFYPLTGVNVSFEKEKIDLTGETHKKSEMGINLGTGIHRQVGNLMVFLEYDYLISELSQHSVLLGAFITIRSKTSRKKDLEHESDRGAVEKQIR